MTDSAQQTTPEPELVPQRDLPRLLRPFRTSAYRRLAVSLVLTTFAFGVWVVGQVWEVIRIGGGPSQLSVVSTATAIGVLLPALLAGRRRRPGAAEDHPALGDRRPAGRHERGGGAVPDRPDPGLAPRGGGVHDRHVDGVLLPRLLRVAARPGARVRPAGGQRLRGDGPTDGRSGDRAGGRRRRGRSRLVGRGGGDRGRGPRRRPARPGRGAGDARSDGRPWRERRPTRCRRRWPTCGRGSST